jgi:hypothetical protein
MVRQIVNRCNVGDSNLDVIKYLVSRLRKPSFATWLTIDKDERKRMMRDAIAIHAENRKIYLYVVR